MFCPTGASPASLHRSSDSLSHGRNDSIALTLDTAQHANLDERKGFSVVTGRVNAPTVAHGT
jgi:hypothetical protein